MIEGLTEIVPEVLYSALAGGLTVLGLVAENAGLQTMSGGETTVGLWMAFVGIVALYAGLKVAREKALPGLR